MVVWKVFRFGRVGHGSCYDLSGGGGRKMYGGERGGRRLGIWWGGNR